MCNTPVTFGGGITIVYGSLSSGEELKYFFSNSVLVPFIFNFSRVICFWDIHLSYQKIETNLQKMFFLLELLFTFVMEKYFIKFAVVIQNLSKLKNKI